jgi:hypothetical protein
MRKQDKSDKPELVTREQLFRRLVIEPLRKMSPEEKAKAREGFDRYLGLKKS